MNLSDRLSDIANNLELKQEEENKKSQEITEFLKEKQLNDKVAKKVKNLEAFLINRAEEGCREHIIEYNVIDVDEEKVPNKKLLNYLTNFSKKLWDKLEEMGLKLELEECYYAGNGWDYDSERTSYNMKIVW